MVCVCDGDLHLVLLLWHFVLQDKVKAATDLIAKLRKHRPTLIQAMEQLCEAYIDLAYHDVQAFRKQRGPFRLPASCPLLKLPKSRLEEVAMPTKELEV